MLCFLLYLIYLLRGFLSLCVCTMLAWVFEESCSNKVILWGGVGIFFFGVFGSTWMMSTVQPGQLYCGEKSWIKLQINLGFNGCLFVPSCCLCSNFYKKVQIIQRRMSKMSKMSKMSIFSSTNLDFGKKKLQIFVISVFKWNKVSNTLHIEWRFQFSWLLFLFLFLFVSVLVVLFSLLHFYLLQSIGLGASCQLL